MKFYNPKTVPISLTGKRCSLMCDHCRGHYLQSMTDARGLNLSLLESDNGFLISGGFDKKGRIPLSENDDLLKKLKAKGRLNIHPGFLENRDLDLLCSLEPVISFDFQQDLAVIQGVFHLPYTPRDYLNQYQKMVERGLYVVPHILLGLGKEDKKALDMVCKFSPPKVVLLVFRPTINTPFRGKELPCLKEMGKLWQRFRESYPGEIVLGCMRPGGSYRTKLDFLAFKSGFDGIVKPSAYLRDHLEKKDLCDKTKQYDYCCAFKE